MNKGSPRAYFPRRLVVHSSSSAIFWRFRFSMKITPTKMTGLVFDDAIERILNLAPLGWLYPRRTYASLAPVV